jgi:hypothetical protein
LPASLPREIVVLPLPAAACVCATCGSTKLVIGYDEAEQLDLELGMRERPLEHPVRPPAEVEGTSRAAFARGGEVAGDASDVGVRRLRHDRSAVAEVGLAQHAHLQVDIVDEALHDVADAHDALKATWSTTGTWRVRDRVMTTITSRTLSSDEQVVTRGS